VSRRRATVVRIRTMLVDVTDWLAFPGIYCCAFFYKRWPADGPGGARRTDVPMVATRTPHFAALNRAGGSPLRPRRYVSASRSLRPRRYVSASRFYVFYSLRTSRVELGTAPLTRIISTVWVRGRFVFSILVSDFKLSWIVTSTSMVPKPDCVTYSPYPAVSCMLQYRYLLTT
jgi:hypothetical protein